MVTINWEQGPKKFMPVMRINGWRVSRLAMACLLAGVVAATAQGTPDYSGSSTSVSIPFVPQTPPLGVPPQMMVKVTLQPPPAQPTPQNLIPITMDTGSTGALLSPDQVPGYKTGSGTPGYQFYSSSKLLSVGTWVPATITFYGDPEGSTELATASVPVLVVEQQVYCPQYKQTSNGTCPCGAGSNTCPCSQDPTKIANCPCPTGGNTCLLYQIQGRMTYMGVGFGQEEDFMPQGTPDKNPLLNMTSIAGQPVTGTLNPGYIIGSTGVTVGLTPANTSGFGFIKLTPYPQSQYPGDWMPASMCVQIDGSDCFPGNVLVDAGVSQSYITVPQKFPTDPSQTPPVLTNGTTVVLKLPAPSPEQPNPVVVDSFTVSPGALCQPPRVIPDWPETPPPGPFTSFVNTGRTFLQKYQFLYDAKNGYVGLKPQANGCGG